MTMAQLRLQMDEINEELVRLLGKRLQLAKAIARLKKEGDLPILDPAREEQILLQVRELARKYALSVPVVEEMFQLILDYTRLEMGAV